jgi:hypothetical protein
MMSNPDGKAKEKRERFSKEEKLKAETECRAGIGMDQFMLLSPESRVLSQGAGGGSGGSGQFA